MECIILNILVRILLDEKKNWGEKTPSQIYVQKQPPLLKVTEAGLQINCIFRTVL